MKKSFFSMKCTSAPNFTLLFIYIAETERIKTQPFQRTIYVIHR